MTARARVVAYVCPCGQGRFEIDIDEGTSEARVDEQVNGARASVISCNQCSRPVADFVLSPGRDLPYRFKAEFTNVIFQTAACQTVNVTNMLISRDFYSCPPLDPKS